MFNDDDLQLYTSNYNNTNSLFSSAEKYQHTIKTSREAGGNMCPRVVCKWHKQKYEKITLLMWIIEQSFQFKNMKQDKTKPYQVCFLSTDDIVSKDKDIMKMGTFITGEINLRRCLTAD